MKINYHSRRRFIKRQEKKGNVIDHRSLYRVFFHLNTFRFLKLLLEMSASWYWLGCSFPPSLFSISVTGIAQRIEELFICTLNIAFDELHGLGLLGWWHRILRQALREGFTIKHGKVILTRAIDQR